MSSLDVDTLFQTRTISEVREVQAQTKNAIEQKKKQLRLEVGNSYRDLISSADTIVEISDQSQRLVKLVKGIESKLAGLADGVETRRRTSQGATTASSLDKLFALGSRIKYLIDTPETIWGCLDSQDYLAAAQRSVYAGHVHKAFSTRSKQVNQHFPLLQHQWPLVKKLSGTIWEQGTEWLASRGGTSSPQSAATLAALALLRPIDGAEVLKMYLNARQRYILSCLTSAAVPEGQTDPDSLTVVLGDVAILMCSTVAQCGELFMQFSGVMSRPLLLQTAEEMAASELLFDASSTTDAAEAAAAAAHRDSVAVRLGSLSSAGVSMECSRWLEVTAQQAATAVMQLLSACGTASDLAKLEAGVKAALDEWSYTITPEGNNTTHISDTNTINSTSTTGAGLRLNWNDACQWVLGQPVPLWPLLLEKPLLERARELVALKFKHVEQQAEELVGAAVVEALALPPAAPGSLDPGSCDDVIALQPASPGATFSQATGAGGGAAQRRNRGLSKRKRRTTSLSPPAAASDSSIQTGHSAWLAKAEHGVRQLDSCLLDALGAAVDLCQSIRHTQGAGVGVDPAVAARAAALEPFIQEKCIAAMEAVTHILTKTLVNPENSTFGSSSPVLGADDFAGGAHAALILGRVALSLAEGSVPLRVLLGVPSHWAAGLKSLQSGGPSSLSAVGVGSGGVNTTSNPRIDEVHRKLRQAGNAAYDTWASWAAAGLSRRLVNDLAVDATLRSDAAQRGWEEVVLSSSGGDQGDDMKFFLPAAPSPAALALALHACGEIERAGGHVIHSSALSLLRWKLSLDISSMLRHALANDGPLAGPSERGSLQLMFDARFLLGSLLTGAAPPPQSGGVRDATSLAAAATTLRREVSQLETEIASGLDPIDWATYDAHVSANVARFSARSKVLLGNLRRGAPSDTLTSAAATTVSGGQPAESNVLKMAPAGARFAYLPVNTPSVLRSQSSLMAQGGRGLSGFSRDTMSGLSLVSPDPASHYSFAALVGEPNKARKAAAAAAAASGSPLSSNLAGASSAFDAIRQSRFGSLLGDKAAEAAASVQEFSLGGLSAGGGLFSGLNLPSFNKK